MISSAIFILASILANFKADSFILFINSALVKMSSTKETKRCGLAFFYSKTLQALAKS